MIANSKTLATALLAGLALVRPAHAGVVFNDLSDPGIGNRPAIPSVFQSFSTGAGSFSLTDVMLVLSGGTADNNFVSIDLYADSSTSPASTPLFHIGSKVDNTLTVSCSCTYDFPTAPFALSPNTRYWIGLSSADGSAITWTIAGGFVTPAPSDVGVVGEFNNSNVSSTFSPDISGSGFLQVFQMEVTDSPTLTSPGAPEPASLLLGVTGLAALMLRRRWSSKARRSRSVL